MEVLADDNGRIYCVTRQEFELYHTLQILAIIPRTIQESVKRMRKVTCFYLDDILGRESVASVIEVIGHSNKFGLTVKTLVFRLDKDKLDFDGENVTPRMNDVQDC